MKMILKPQDILVLLKLIAIGDLEWSYNRLAVSLSMSPSEVHAAIKRTLAAQLSIRYENRPKPNIRNLKEFLVYGLRYVFVAVRGEFTRGLPTAIAAPPLSSKLILSGEPPPVWPDPDGEIRGQAFSPLYKSVPAAARQDQQLYELLALVDAIRGGRARERQIAKEEISERLEAYGKISESEH